MCSRSDDLLILPLCSIDCAKLSETHHASSVKTSMHRFRLLSFLRSTFAERLKPHRELISINSIFWLNSKMKY
jgi:hypothetical protein